MSFRAYLSVDAAGFVASTIWLRLLYLGVHRVPGLDWRLRRFVRRAEETERRWMYRGFTRVSGASRFLNYGYVPLDDSPGPELEAEDEPNRVFIQLYDRVIGGTDLTGRDVLEISCGHGGGASYVARYLRPSSMVGVDLNPRGVEVCSANLARPGLEFRVANAMDLPFPDDSFDAVLNIEASHCYPSFPAFLREVRRVLRPGGRLLFADLRWGDEARSGMLADVSESGFVVAEREEVTANVLAALEAYSETRRESVNALLPGPLREVALLHFAVPGSPLFNAFEAGEASYTRFVLVKPAD